MAPIDDQRPFIVIFLQPSTAAGGHKMASLALFGSPCCQQLNCHSLSAFGRLPPSAKISCPHGRPILLEFREYPPPPLSVPIWLETKTVFLSKVAPLGANRNWPWQRARVKLVRGSVAAIPQCGISVGFLETYPSTARRTQPTPLFPDRTNAVSFDRRARFS